MGEGFLPDSRFTPVPDGTVHSLDWGGSGVPVHFLHANGFCAGTYTPFLSRLSTSLRVEAGDIRGHGDTRLPVPDPVSGWSLFADDLCQWIRRRYADPIIGLGHSLGGTATVMAAANGPELFSAIVLIDPVILPPTYLWALQILRWIGQQGRMPLAQRARRRKRRFSSMENARQRFSAGRGMFRTWQEAFIDAYLEWSLRMHEDGSAELKCSPELEAQIYESVPRNVMSFAARIRCPVLTVRGAQSDTFLPGPAARLERLIPDCRSVVIHDAGHFIPMERPEWLAQIILEFTRSLDGQ